MADTSFRFGGAENDDNLISSEDDCLEFEEEEYDALNDETFGTLEDSTGVDDWEEQHEHFAELAEAENSKNNKLTISKKSLNNLVLTESNLYPTSKDSVWSYNETNRNGDVRDSPVLSNVHSSPLLTSNKGSPGLIFNKASDSVVTVEELERSLLNNWPKGQPLNRNVLQHPRAQIALQQAPGRYPPGLFPPAPPPPPPLMGISVPLPSHMRPLHPGAPQIVRMMPPNNYIPQGHQHGPAPPSGIYPPNPPFPMYHPINFPLPMRIPPPPRMHNMVPHPNMPMVPPLNHQNHNYTDQHRRNYYNNNNLHNRGEPYDEYAGLMSNREKQWLINIQLVQLNTGTPYFDDYYYTVFKERKLQNIKENQPPTFERPRRHSVRRNSEREGQNSLTPKVYTPLQFENSLGKLQCGSVTAPRKIIDMDIVTPDKDGEINSNTSKDTKKTKQLLLDLETLYNYILKVEDLKNPLYKSNMEKLVEIKQKQKLRELETATTTEQKQEIIKSLRQDSEPFHEDPQEFLGKVVSGFLQEEKFVNFLNIRKGKMLLIRILPYLTNDKYFTQLCDLWSKVFLSIPLIGRKDMCGDNLIIRLYPFFKRFIQGANMKVILELTTSLHEVSSPDISRSTPIIGKQLLNSIVANKFGVSALAVIVMRVEQLISGNSIDDLEQKDWFDFVTNWAESLLVPKIVLEIPIEPIPINVFNKHCTLISSLTEENKIILEKCLTSCS